MPLLSHSPPRNPWRTQRRADHPRPRHLLEHEHEVPAVAFTPDGRHVLSASDDGVLKIWEWGTGKLVCPPLALGGAGLSLSVTLDGRRVASGGLMNDLPVFHLADWLAPALLEPDDLCLWGRSCPGSGSRHAGGELPLRAAEPEGRWVWRLLPGWPRPGPAAGAVPCPRCRQQSLLARGRAARSAGTGTRFPAAAAGRQRGTATTGRNRSWHLKHWARPDEPGRAASRRYSTHCSGGCRVTIFWSCQAGPAQTQWACSK
jgi:hypothetical protein